MSGRQPPPRKRRPLSSFGRDRRGASAVEFALIAPLLIVLYCGMVEMTQVMMAQRRLSNIASAIGDLMAQASQTGPSRANDIFYIGRTIMAPFPTTDLNMCLASITSDDKGKDTVTWRQPSNASMANCPAANAVLTDVPIAVLPANQTVIMARATYVYASPIKLVLPKSMTFTRTYYLRPRRTDSVIWNSAN